MLSEISADALSDQVTRDVHVHAAALAQALGTRLGRPRTPRIAADVSTVVKYAQGDGARLSNDAVLSAMNSVIDVLASTCYSPATPVARAIFDRKAGEVQTEVELVLLAARARWGIELGLEVPIRWLAALGGVAVKTARNLASAGKLHTVTKRDGQVSPATSAAAWLAERNVTVKAGSRRVPRQ